MQGQMCAMFVCFLTQYHLVSNSVLTRIKGVSLQEEMSYLYEVQNEVVYPKLYLTNLTCYIFTKNHVGHLSGFALFYICGGTTIFFYMKPLVRVMMMR